MGTPAKHPRDAAAASRIPQRLQAAVATVSTAQILRASGYSAAEAAALRALSDIAGRYIQSLGRTAAALAEAHGRTEPNVADVVLALEEHALDGFPGASDPARPVLCSAALAELAGFVDAVTEVPFAKPLPRRDPGSGAGKGWESFAAAEREPPLRHVPHWLPRFPEGWEERLRGRGEAAAKDDKDTGEVMTVMPNGVVVENGRRAAVPENREKVSFRLAEKRQRHDADKGGSAVEEGSARSVPPIAAAWRKVLTTRKSTSSPTSSSLQPAASASNQRQPPCFPTPAWRIHTTCSRE